MFHIKNVGLFLESQTHLSQQRKNKILDDAKVNTDKDDIICAGVVSDIFPKYLATRFLNALGTREHLDAFLAITNRKK